MRRKKNITLNLKNITAHFTGKAKIITLVSINIMLSFVNISLYLSNVPNTSALNYQTEANISFTFNPTLSVSISPSDLVISNLTPGTTDTSNEISVNIATNNFYGYKLYATVGSNTAAYNSTNLTHTNGVDTFSSISPTANFTDLTDFSTNATDNTWGYTYSLDNGTTWSKYNGLPIYNTDSPTRLVKTTELSEDTIDFKIAAKSSPTQASGTYTNVINFTAITNLAPLSLAESYEAYYQKTGKTKLDGYYVMQDMNKEICDNAEIIDSELQVIDNRDHKIYWIAKLKDDHCWMTQNLDLDLISDPTAESYVALTSENTDLNNATNTAYQDGYSINENSIIKWIPERNTIIGIESGDSFTFPGWEDDIYHPYSGDVGNLYINSSIGSHGLAGNYYNYTAAIASNNTSSIEAYQAQNSICPVNWKLPNRNNFDSIIAMYSNLRNSPTDFLTSEFISSGNISTGHYYYGYYHSNEASSSVYAYKMVLFSWNQSPMVSNGYSQKSAGISIRCLAR